MKKRSTFIIVPIIVILIFVAIFMIQEKNHITSANTIIDDSILDEEVFQNEVITDKRVLNWEPIQNYKEIEVNGNIEHIRNSRGITPVMATNGLIGWSLTVELDGGRPPTSFEEAMKINERNRFDRYVDVYADDLTTVIGQFRVLGSENPNVGIRQYTAEELIEAIGNIPEDASEEDISRMFA